MLPSLHFPHPYQPAETVWNWLWHCALCLGWVLEKSQLGGCKKSAHTWASTPQRHIHDTHWPSINWCFCDPLHAPTSRQANWTKKNIAVLLLFLFLLFELALLLAKAFKMQVEFKWSAATSVGNTLSSEPILPSKENGSQSKPRKTCAGTVQTKMLLPGIPICEVSGTAMPPEKYS